MLLNRHCILEVYRLIGNNRYRPIIGHCIIGTPLLYTVHYDETTNTKSQKELQIKVLFWHEDKQEVECHHLETCFIGQATGDILHSYILKAVDNACLPLQNMLMLSSDGPTVNKKVFRLVNEAVKACRSGNSLTLELATYILCIMHS